MSRPHMSDDGEHIDMCSLENLTRCDNVTERVVIIEGAERNVGQCCEVCVVPATV